jgi:phage shock protein A
MDESTKKSFWSKPEGKTGLLFLGLLGYGLFVALPTIIALLQNTIYAMILGAVVLGMVTIALDPKFRTLVGYIYKTTMRKITGAFINLDPIAILETYIRDMQDSRQDMNKQVTNLRGQMVSLQQVITKNKADKEANLRRMSKAQEVGQKDQSILMSRKAGRLEKSNMTLSALYTKLEMLYRALAKMYETSGIVLEDTIDEVDVKKREQQALKAGSSAFRSAMKIISGDPDKKYMFDKAMEALVDDIGAKVGEMERFMELSAKVIASVDLDNAVYEEEGFAMLEKWQNEGTSILLGNEKPILIAKAQDSLHVLDLNAPISTGANKKNKYSEMLEK